MLRVKPHDYGRATDRNMLHLVAALRPSGRRNIANAHTKTVTFGMPFQKGHKRYGGRAPNQPNHLTADVKAMIEQALSEVGGKDYLKTQASENPTAFMSLIGRLLPKDSNVNVKGELDVRAWLQSLGEPD